MELKEHQKRYYIELDPQARHILKVMAVTSNVTLKQLVADGLRRAYPEAFEPEALEQPVKQER